jgi:hypothetical protein
MQRVNLRYTQDECTQELLNVLKNCDPNDPKLDEIVGYWVDALSHNKPAIPDFRHACVVLEKQLIDVVYCIVETGIAQNDLIITIESYTELSEINDNVIEILTLYLECLKNTTDHNKRIQTLRNNTQLVKLKIIFNDWLE